MKKLINLFLFAAIAGTSLQSCAKTGCYAVARNGQTSVDNNCNNIADIDENGGNGNGNGNGTVNVGFTYFKLAGHMLGDAQRAYALDNNGYVINISSNELFGGSGKPDANTYCYVAGFSQDGQAALILMTKRDYSDMQFIAAYDNVSGIWKSTRTNKEFYFLASRSGLTAGSTDIGTAVTFTDGTVHYTSGGDAINYKAVASDFH